MRIDTEVYVELGFKIEADYTPGRPAMPPSRSSGGDPPEDPEWDLTEINDITFSTRKLVDGRMRNVELSLLKHVPEEHKKTVRDAIVTAIMQSELGESFFDNVSERAADYANAA